MKDVGNFFTDPMASGLLQAGVIATGDVQAVRAGANSISVAAGVAWVADSSVPGSQLMRVVTAGGLVNVSNAGTARVDQIVLNPDGTVTSIPGTTDSGAVTLDNPVTRPALSTGQLRLADVLAGPTGIVSAASVRDRRPWARGAHATYAASGGGVITGSSSWQEYFGSTARVRLELTGVPVNWLALVNFWNGSSSGRVGFSPYVSLNGAAFALTPQTFQYANTALNATESMSGRFALGGGTALIGAAFYFEQLGLTENLSTFTCYLWEDLRPLANNGTA